MVQYSDLMPGGLLKRLMLFYAAIGREKEQHERFPAIHEGSSESDPTIEQATHGVEGYVFDGVNGTHMAFWTCAENATSADGEYMVVVQGCSTLIIG